MYLPQHFRETDVDRLQAFVEQHPLATLVAGTSDGLTANHLPLLWHRTGQGLLLQGHLARANSLWKLAPNDTEVLAIFCGAQHYVSPNWYPSKHPDGKVVPTWNYAAVYVYGQIRFVEDANWLYGFVEALTNAHEPNRPDRWHVTDAPPAYLQTMLRAVVGLEISVSRIEGKFKSSQNRSQADRDGVAAGLESMGLSAQEISELVRSPTP